MKNRIILYIILIFTFVTAQVTLLNNIKIFGVTPNLIIILIVSISLLEGRIHGATVGFITGLCLDAVIGLSLGFQALLGMLLGLMLGNINKRFFKENIFVMTACTFISTILYESAIAFSSYIYGVAIDFLPKFENVILPESIINSVIGVLLFLVIVRVNRRLLEYEGKNRY